ncbi:hypothetical protein [Psychrobacillus soli]|uniref:Uncharacterized protein n=1 Tax=Psychrobacillus soli TaxID=1543965 RepID=A0A544TKM2_9BACI|nr:hypothetical protein [Psychrobacillus soli]TQR17988.1 hypothetical protein FG383_03825 [Psychrobacillus soli]
MRELYEFPEYHNKKDKSSVEFEKDGCKFYINIYNYNTATNQNVPGNGAEANNGGRDVAGDDQVNDNLKAGKNAANAVLSAVDQEENNSKTLQKADRGGVNADDIDVNI